MQIEVLKISELVPYDKNPRINKNAVDAVANSLREFGFKQPLVIDDNNVLVCGHTRLKAAKKLKIKEVPCVRASDLSDEQIKAYRIADNSTAALAEWDMDLLAVEVGEIEMDLTQFGLEPLQDAEELPEVVEDEAPEVDESTPPVAQLGDIWSLGRHKLMCADSTDAGNVALLMGGVKADLLLTDPPYGIDYGGMLKGKGDGKGGADKNGWKSYDAPDWDKSRPKDVFFEIGVTNSINQIIWGGNYFTDLLPPTMCWLIWDKGQRGFSLADGEMAWTNFNNAMRIKEYSRALANQENKVHPTQKPIEILLWCIKNAERYGKYTVEAILDLFGGSGSTLIACEQLNRTCYMMELDPKYMDVILKRYQNLTGIEPTLNGRTFTEVQHERQTT